MPFLKSKCPQCGKLAETEKVFDFANAKITKLKCGHIVRAEFITLDEQPENVTSLDNRKLFPYQCDGVRFGIRNKRIAIIDEMGLGKTVQALIICAMLKKKFIVICKSSLTEQWQREAMRWIGEDCICQVINDAKDQFLPGFDGYIISYDMVRRFAEKELKKVRDAHKGKDLFEPMDTPNDSIVIKAIKRFNIQIAIMDEVQQIKNSDSKRTVHVRDVCKEVEHVIALSGTPIKNNALEYFPILNILDPMMFPKLAWFQMNDVNNYWDGYRMKIGGLRYPKEFMAKTKDIILRREMKDVKDQLPNPQEPITRNFSFHNMGKEVQKMYDDSLREMLEFMDDQAYGATSFGDEGNILKYLTKMRHIVGLSLIDPCIDHVMEFLGGCDRKILIFVHHIDIGDILMSKLGKLMSDLDLANPIQFQAGDDSMEFVKRFSDPRVRVGVVSTLAGGEGMDGLQHLCNDMIMLERQWNPANEEQAEKRISQRIGQLNHCIGTYFVAVGTVCEFFSEIVERKREIVSKTLSGEAIEWNQSSLMRELTERLQTEGLKKWSLK
jgi:SWI/SNF-related matrix-associated actin-dependent regulator 1 of chromatin subfamily A